MAQGSGASLHFGCSPSHCHLEITGFSRFSPPRLHTGGEPSGPEMCVIAPDKAPPCRRVKFTDPHKGGAQNTPGETSEPEKIFTFIKETHL